MAMRRRSSRWRARRKSNPYDVYRMNLNRKVFGMGGTGDTATTDSIVLLAPGEDAANALTPHIPFPLVDNISKGVILGGMRFWVSWQMNTDEYPAEYADLITIVNVAAFIFKARFDPNNGQIASGTIPEFWHSTHGRGQQGQHQNILWSKVWNIPVGFNDGTTLTELISSDGALAYRTGFGADSWHTTYQPGSETQRIERVKTKRRLDDFDVLMFGVCGSTGVISANPLPIAFNLVGQIACKRSTKRTSL